MRRFWLKRCKYDSKEGCESCIRFGCWPRRSSHGQDRFGSRPCTLAPRPAPKSTTAPSDIDPVQLPFILSPERTRRSSQKKLTQEIFTLSILGEQLAALSFRQLAEKSLHARNPDWHWLPPGRRRQAACAPGDMDARRGQPYPNLVKAGVRPATHPLYAGIASSLETHFSAVSSLP
jgi:hypothetical protein